MTAAPPALLGRDHHPGRRVIINGPHTDWAARYDLVALAVLLAVPLALLAVAVVARRRRRAGWDRGWARRSAACEAGIVLGTVPWVLLTLLPGSGAGSTHEVSLVPLRDLATMPAYQVVGNLLVFAALGALAPVRLAGLARLAKMTALCAGASLAIETAQYLLPLGRVASVDDLLLNTVGGALAAAATRPWWRRVPGARPLAARRPQVVR